MKSSPETEGEFKERISKLTSINNDTTNEIFEIIEEAKKDFWKATTLTIFDIMEKWFGGPE